MLLAQHRGNVINNFFRFLSLLCTSANFSRPWTDLSVASRFVVSLFLFCSYIFVFFFCFSLAAISRKCPSLLCFPVKWIRDWLPVWKIPTPRKKLLFTIPADDLQSFTSGCARNDLTYCINEKRIKATRLLYVDAHQCPNRQHISSSRKILNNRILPHSHLQYS